jgi:hypothetical protein
MLPSKTLTCTAQSSYQTELQVIFVSEGDQDRRDAERLLRSYRSGDLTPVWVPDEGSESLRDLVRAREAAKQEPCFFRREG